MIVHAIHTQFMKSRLQPLIFIVNHTCHYFLLVKHTMINVSSRHLGLDEWDIGSGKQRA